MPQTHAHTRSTGECQQLSADAHTDTPHAHKTCSSVTPAPTRLRSWVYQALFSVQPETHTLHSKQWIKIRYDPAAATAAAGTS